MVKRILRTIKPKIEYISEDLRRHNGKLQVRDLSTKYHYGNNHPWDNINERASSLTLFNNLENIKEKIAELDMPQEYRQSIFNRCKRLINQRKEEIKTIEQIKKTLK